MKLAAWAVAAALVLAAMQALVAARAELTFDEAYYALWARWPQAGYLDHPPLVAWMIAASTRALGRSEFGVRALFWLCGALTPGLIAWIARRLFDDRAAAAAVLVWCGAPLAAGAPLATPDTPLTFFWTLALAGLVEVWRGRSRAWLAVGLAAGAAGLAKMTAGFLAMGVGLALAATPSLRPQLLRPGPWLAAIAALATLAPFLAWNLAHGMATFAKQGGRLQPRGFAPRYLAELVGSQIALFNPLTTVAVALAKPWRRSASEPARLLIATIAPALAYFVLHALHDRVQGNWPAPLYPALALLAGRVLGDGRVTAAAAALGLLTTAAVYVHVAIAWPTIGPRDPALRIGGWRDLTLQVSRLAAARHAHFVVADGYAATSLLSFYGAGTPEVVEFAEPERWTFHPPVDTRGAGLAFGPPGFAETLSQRFAQVAEAARLRRRVGGVELEPYVVYTVSGDRAAARDRAAP